MAASISSHNRAPLEFVQLICSRLGLRCGSIGEGLDTPGPINGREVKPATKYWLSLSVKTLTPDFFLIKEHRRRADKYFAKIESYPARDKRLRRWKVVSVEITEREEPVYCPEISTTGSFVLEGYLLTGNSLGNPQDHYGIAQSKPMEVMIFAGKRDQAKAHLWRDLHDVIVESECFTGSMGRNFVSKDDVLMLSVYAPYDEIRMRKQAAKGIYSGQDMATFQIMPKESNPLAARGGAGFIFGFDEAAHVKTTGMTRSFGEVYNAAKPALDQFGPDSFTCLPSSTWEMTGMFYELWVLSLRDDPRAPGEPMFPSKLMLQLSSWHPYQDWQRAHLLPLFPAGYEGDLGEYKGQELPVLPPIKGAIQDYDEEMEKEERANPDTFGVERRSQWATSLDSYLNSARVLDVFKPWAGRRPEWGRPELTEQVRGPLSIAYVAHGDPATVNHRFGFCVGHAEPGPDGMQHAVIDLIKHWDPVDFPDHTIDYDIVVKWIFENVIMMFQPTEMSFDQFNVVSTVHRLRKDVHEAHLQKNVMIFESPATNIINWARWECTKAAINMAFVHSYSYPELASELKFARKPEGINKVVPPDSGPCVTIDIADAFSHVVFSLLGEQMNIYLSKELQNARLGVAMSPGTTDPYNRFSPGQQDGNPYAGLLGNPAQGALARGMHPGRPLPPGVPRTGRVTGMRRGHRS